MNMAYYVGNRNKTKTYEARFIIKMAKWLKLIELHGSRCTECSEDLYQSPWSAQFHHIGNKNNEIGMLSGGSFERMKSEAIGCKMVCENCHRRIHEEIDLGKKPNVNKILFLTYKNTTSCTKCGYDKNYKSLDFHHESSKSYEISDLVGKSSQFISNNIEAIKLELDKCIVICANCHRKIHFNTVRYYQLFDRIIVKKNSIKDNYQVKVDHVAVIDLHNKGLSQLNISRELGCGLSTVCGILKENNIHTRENIKVDVYKVRQLIEKGMNNSQINRELGYARQTIDKIRKSTTPP